MVGQRNGFPHEPGPEKRSRADNLCIRLEMALRIFLVSTEILRILRNPANSQKSCEFTEFLQIHRNPTNSQKSYAFTEILRIHRNPRNSQKSDEFTRLFIIRLFIIRVFIIRSYIRSLLSLKGQDQDQDQDQEYLKKLSLSCQARCR